MTPEIQVDLTNCDHEPIHIPGQIQSHGCLLVVDNDLVIRYHSDNVRKYFPHLPASLLELPISRMETALGDDYRPDSITQLIKLGRINNTFEQSNPFLITEAGKKHNLIISATPDKYYLLEFEPANTDIDVQRMIGHSVSEILTEKNLIPMLHNAASQVKKVIDFDRVMVYRFADDGHGEVVAEARNENLEPWLGLHYPASDIPRQAKELYKVNLTRLIADVHTTPSKIVTYNSNNQHLDLTYSQLRAVSPIHIQYLKNMGVASSFSISLLYKKELWGLIACHNYTPKFIDFKARESSKLIGQILSSALEFRQDEENQKMNEQFKNNVEALAKTLQKNVSVEAALTAETITLMDITHATGATLVYENNISRLGKTPDDLQLKPLLKWIKDNINESIYYTDNLSSVYPEAALYKHTASGLLVSVLSKELNEYVLFFKPETTQTVNWAGNPEKPATVNTNGVMSILPRNSFAVWRQTVMGTSEKWGAEEIKSVLQLKEEVMYATNMKAGAIRLLNEKLRYAYEELDTFSFTISHDLKNPITAIKSYAQVLTRDESIGLRGQKVLLNIVDRADKMNRMINEVLDYSRIGRSEIEYKTVNMQLLIGEIIKELEYVYDTRQLQLTISQMPDVQGDPVMISQLFSNLVSNAIKYSQHVKPSVVRIEGKVVDGDVSYSIQDNGIGIPVKDLPKIFELFNRMDNVKHIEGSGVGLAIVKRIVEKHSGKIWAESELGKGSTFYVTFKNNVTKGALQTIAEGV